MKYKEFKLKCSSHECGNNCPYCVAEISKGQSVDNKLGLLENKLRTLKDNNISFKNFIFCENGESSPLEFSDFKTIVDATKNVDIFDKKRFASSGEIFYDNEKFNLIKDDFTIEITRVSIDSEEDMKILGYNRDYINTDNFKKAKIHLNYVLMKNKSFKAYLEEIQKYLEKFPNITTISLKILNSFTERDNLDSLDLKWLLKNVLEKCNANELVDFMSSNTSFLSIIDYMNSNNNFVTGDKKCFYRYEWNYNGIPIIFDAKKITNEYSNIGYYGGNLVNC